MFVVKYVEENALYILTFCALYETLNSLSQYMFYSKCQCNLTSTENYGRQEDFMSFQRNLINDKKIRSTTYIFLGKSVLSDLLTTLLQKTISSRGKQQKG